MGPRRPDRSAARLVLQVAPESAWSGRGRPPRRKVPAPQELESIRARRAAGSEDRADVTSASCHSLGRLLFPPSSRSRRVFFYLCVYFSKPVCSLAVTGLIKMFSVGQTAPSINSIK